MSLPCECSMSDVDWETDVSEFEFDGECYLQPGECCCREERLYYKRWDMVGVQSEDGQMVRDFTSRY